MADIALGIGLQGLLSAQSALDTLGHNLANANTPGYSRQRLSLQAQRPLSMGGTMVGRGVRTDGIRRISDNVLNRRIVSQTSIAAKLDAGVLALSGVESMLGGIGGVGIGAMLDGFFESVSSLAGDAGDLVRRNGVVQSAESLTNQFHQIADSSEGLKGDTLEQVRALSKQVNSLAVQVRDMNKEIASSEAGGGSANDLRDQRDVALQSLANLVDVRYQESATGSVTLSIGGHLLAGENLVQELRAELNDDGELEMYVGDTTRPVEVRGGQIGGLVDFMQNTVPELEARMDTLARNLIFEVNRAHSTGIPSAGGFQTLTSTNSLEDIDGDGQYLDQRIGDSGLPFDIQDGTLAINVTNASTGEVRTHQIEIEDSMSVQDLLDRINAIDNVAATIDGSGRLQMTGQNGNLFDFSNRLDGMPDEIGSFGGMRASVSSLGEEPFVLADGMTFDFDGIAGPFTITLDASDFDNISQATASEVAGVLSQNPMLATNGMRAAAVDGHLVLQSSSGGPTQGFDVTGGSALAAMGIPTGTYSGSTISTSVSISGAYSGAANQELTMRPLGDGQIGSTQGLQIEVRNQMNEVVAVLDVGSDYVPGTPLDLGDGLQASFTVGELSATDQDFLVVHALADSDTSDMLAAFGMNAFFSGSDAKSIGVSQRIVDDPSLMSASKTGGAGDNGALLQILKLQSGHVEGLNSGFSQYFGDVVGDVGFDIETKQRAADTERYLVDSLQQRRDEVSGVSVDEELVDMIRFEQAYTASARFIQVVQQITDTTLQLI